MILITASSLAGRSECYRDDTTGKTPADLPKELSSPPRKNILLSESKKL
jgi:hypothetical protein